MANLLGKTIKHFISKMGTILRHSPHITLQVPSWSNISNEAKERLWAQMLESVELKEENKKWIMQWCGERYKDRKGKLKKRCFEKKTIQEQLAHRPFDIKTDDWKWLVEYWHTLESEAVLKRNSENRSHQSIVPVGGSRSFAQYTEDLTANGVSPTRIELFKCTRAKKDKQPSDKTSEEIMSKFDQYLNTPGSTSANAKNYYIELRSLERHGRVRGFGLGLTKELNISDILDISIDISLFSDLDICINIDIFDISINNFHHFSKSISIFSFLLIYPSIYLFFWTSIYPSISIFKSLGPTPSSVFGPSSKARVAALVFIPKFAY